jgi:uncharacterized alpha/beta hydrolase family protein
LSFLLIFKDTTNPVIWFSLETMEQVEREEEVVEKLEMSKMRSPYEIETA